MVIEPQLIEHLRKDEASPNMELFTIYYIRLCNYICSLYNGSSPCGRFSSENHDHILGKLKKNQDRFFLEIILLEPSTLNFTAHSKEKNQDRFFRSSALERFNNGLCG